MRVEHGGHALVRGGGPGAADLSLIASQGHSTAVWLNAEECRVLAVRLLALGFGVRPTEIVVFFRANHKRYHEIRDCEALLYDSDPEADDDEIERLESSADDEIPPGLEGPLDPDYDLNRDELGPSSRPPGCPEC